MTNYIKIRKIAGDGFEPSIYGLWARRDLLATPPRFEVCLYYWGTIPHNDIITDKGCVWRTVYEGARYVFLGRNGGVTENNIPFVAFV